MCQAGDDRIAIILVNYNGARDTIECLDSIRALKLPPGGAAVYVVDNASRDDSRERLQQWLQREGSLPENEDDRCSANVESAHGCCIRVSLLQAKENRGFAAGCNLGLANAYQDPSTSHFWLLNNDAVVDSAAAAELLACSHKQGDRSICGSTLLYYDDPKVVQAAGGARYLPMIGRSRHAFKRERYSEIAQGASPKLDYIVGASMFFSRGVLETVGYLPERYFLYAEEADWCTRARQCGILLEWARRSLVLHKEGRSTGAGARFQNLGDSAFYHVSRNNLLFLWDHSKPFVFTAMGYCIFEALSYALKGDPGKLLVGFRACRDFWHLRNQKEEVQLPSPGNSIENNPAEDPAANRRLP